MNGPISGTHELPTKQILAGAVIGGSILTGLGLGVPTVANIVVNSLGGALPGGAALAALVAAFGSAIGYAIPSAEDDANDVLIASSDEKDAEFSRLLPDIYMRVDQTDLTGFVKKVKAMVRNEGMPDRYRPLFWKLFLDDRILELPSGDTDVNKSATLDGKSAAPSKSQDVKSPFLEFNRYYRHVVSKYERQIFNSAYEECCAIGPTLSPSFISGICLTIFICFKGDTFTDYVPEGPTMITYAKKMVLLFNNALQTTNLGHDPPVMFADGTFTNHNLFVLIDMILVRDDAFIPYCIQSLQDIQDSLKHEGIEFIDIDPNEILKSYTEDTNTTKDTNTTEDTEDTKDTKTTKNIQTQSLLTSNRKRVEQRMCEDKPDEDFKSEVPLLELLDKSWVNRVLLEHGVRAGFYTYTDIIDIKRGPQVDANAIIRETMLLYWGILSGWLPSNAHQRTQFIQKKKDDFCDLLKEYHKNEPEYQQYFKTIDTDANRDVGLRVARRLGDEGMQLVKKAMAVDKSYVQGQLGYYIPLVESTQPFMNEDEKKKGLSGNDLMQYCSMLYFTYKSILEKVAGPSDLWFIDGDICRSRNQTLRASLRHYNTIYISDINDKFYYYTLGCFRNFIEAIPQKLLTTKHAAKLLETILSRKPGYIDKLFRVNYEHSYNHPDMNDKTETQVTSTKCLYIPSNAYDFEKFTRLVNGKNWNRCTRTQKPIRKADVYKNYNTFVDIMNGPTAGQKKDLQQFIRKNDGIPTEFEPIRYHVWRALLFHETWNPPDLKNRKPTDDAKRRKIALNDKEKKVFNKICDTYKGACYDQTDVNMLAIFTKVFHPDIEAKKIYNMFTYAKQFFTKLDKEGKAQTQMTPNSNESAAQDGMLQNKFTNRFFSLSDMYRIYDVIFAFEDLEYTRCLAKVVTKEIRASSFTGSSRFKTKYGHLHIHAERMIRMAKKMYDTRE